MAIQIENLVKVYLGSDKKPFRAVDELNLHVRRGEILAFLGPNGAGKTTTIKTIVGLVAPDQGRILVDGLDVAHHRAQGLRRVGAVLEGNRNIYWNLTVLENLRYFGTLKEVPPKVLKGRIAELLRFFELEEKRDVLGQKLSRGMQQKLAIACSLLHDPEILLLDEPTLGLDVAASRMVRDRVFQLAREQGRTIVLTTHQLDVAQELSDRVAIINKGRLKTLDETAHLIGMFSRQEYAFKVAGPMPEAELAQYGNLTITERNGETAFRMQMASGDALYAIMATLQQAGSQVVAVNKIEANLEEIFVQVTEERKEPSGREVEVSA